MKTIAVIFGGRSTEHDVSVITAIASIIKPLRLTKQYNVEPIYISKDGSWYWDQKLGDISTFTSGEIDEFMQKAPKVHLLFDKGMTVVKSSQFAGRKQYKKIDLVFPAMHGTHGEDGELMGLLEMANVPYVGCNMPASVLAMDKVLAKQVAAANGVQVGNYKCILATTFAKKTSEVINRIESSLKYPLFVKPAHLGSSIGITRVAARDQLMNALEVACHYDDKVIVEEEVSNLIEVTLPIMGNDELTYALLERPLTEPGEFFDFDTKYMQGGKKGGAKKSGTQGYSQLPAELPKDLEERAFETAGTVYRSLGCSGIARVDMLIDSKTKQVYFNEVNPLPGGLYQHNWAKSGISAVELVNRLIVLAEQRWQGQQNKNFAFTTNYLRQF